MGLYNENSYFGMRDDIDCIDFQGYPTGWPLSSRTIF